MYIHVHVHVIIIIQTVNVGNATNIVNKRILYIVTDVLVQVYDIVHVHGCAVLIALPCCLFDLACFFRPSF